MEVCGFPLVAELAVCWRRKGGPAISSVHHPPIKPVISESRPSLVFRSCSLAVDLVDLGRFLRVVMHVQVKTIESDLGAPQGGV